MPQDVVESLRDDVVDIKRRIAASQPRTSGSLSPIEWKILAILVADGLLRRRGYLASEKKIVVSLRSLALESKRQKQKEGFSDRELFHLRNCFCPLSE